MIIAAASAARARSIETMHSFEYQGRTYYLTGKTGTNTATGAAVRECETNDHSRVWAANDGRLFSEFKETP